MIIYLNQLGGVLGDIAIDSCYDGHGLPHEVNAWPGEHRKLSPFPFRPCRIPSNGSTQLRGLLTRQDPDHAIVPHSEVDADSLDLGMRIGTAHEGGVHGPRQADIIDVTRTPREKAQVLAAGDACTDILGCPQAHPAPPGRIAWAAARIEVTMWT